MKIKNNCKKVVLILYVLIGEKDTASVSRIPIKYFSSKVHNNNNFSFIKKIITFFFDSYDNCGFMRNPRVCNSSIHLFILLLYHITTLLLVLVKPLWLQISSSMAVFGRQVIFEI